MKKLDFIFDTDAGSDCDDMMALAYLVYAVRKLNVDIKCVTYSHVCKEGPAAIRAFFRERGEKIPPIGQMTHGKAIDDNYCKAIADKYAVEADRAPVPDAVSVLRKALTESENAVICAVGPLTNIGDLLLSKPDDISPLDGVALVKEKCAKVVMMAGEFVPEKGKEIKTEWNVLCDVDACRTVASLCPVPMLWLPWETGFEMKTGKPILDKYGDSNPLALAFTKYPWVDADGRHSWDPATAVYAVEGAKTFFKENVGTVTVDEKGVTALLPDENGKHTVLTMLKKDGMTELEVKAECAAYIDACALEVYPEDNKEI